MTVALHNDGRVFKELGQFESALSHLLYSKQLSEDINDQVGIAYSYDELGDLQIRQRHYDSALVLLRSSLALTRKFEEHVLEPKTLLRIAGIYVIHGEFDHALSLYDSVYHLHEKTN